MAGEISKGFSFTLRSGFSGALLVFCLAALGFIAGVWLVALAYLTQAQSDAERVAASERRNVALALASQINAATTQVDDALTTMRHFWQEGSQSEFRRQDLARFAADRRSPFFEQIVVFDRDGRVIYTTPTGFLDRPVPAGDVEHFFVHRADPPADRLYVGRPFFGRVAGRWHVQMTRPIIDAAGRFDGVIAASVRPERFAALHRSLSMGEGGIIAVVHETGEYIARNERHDDAVGRMADVNPALFLNEAGEAEFRLTPKLDGTVRIYSLRKVPDAPMVLAIGQTEAEISAPVEALRRRLYGWLGGFTLLSGALLAGFIAAARQRGAALAALHDSQTRLRGMFEQSNTGIAFITPDRRLVDCNEAFARLIGYGRPELLGRDFADFTDPEDMAQEAPLVEEMRQGARETLRLEKRYIVKGGGQVWVDLSAAVIRDEQGAPRLLVGTVYDITERKKNEQALAESNAELERFGYVASHDLRQPLRMVVSYLTLLERGADGLLHDEMREYLNYARAGAQRMDQMLVSLLEYSRVGRRGEPMELLNSREVLEEALLFVSPDVAISGAAVTVVGDWPQIFAARDEMVRLLQNLLSNALKYRAPDHRPRITVCVAPHAGEWLFSVEDEGIGFPPDQVGRLFKVFQRLTTPDQYDGTGIGLAVCRKIVERHGGRIWAESPGPGRGAKFSFTLPMVKEAG
jgi:PAS domain S-box-containing protein